MLEVKLNVVNKKDYEEKHNYREVVIKLPKTDSELRKDFEYLGLDYDNLSIQDTHIKSCKFIDKEKVHDSFCRIANVEIQSIINKGFESGYTAPYQDVKKLYKQFADMRMDERDKAVSLIKLKSSGINCIKDIFNKLERIEDFTYYIGIETGEEYLMKRIQNNDISIKDIIQYIDLGEVGEALLEDEEHIFTESGLIVEDISVDKDFIDEEEFE